MPCRSPASIAVSGLTRLKRRATAWDIAATAALRCQSSSRGRSSPLSESTFFSCDIAKAMAALRTMLKPMRAIAVRSSVMGLPVKLMAAELAICMSRAASAGSEPTTRTTFSCETSSSARTLRIRSAMSGKLGRSTLPRDSSAANACTKANASGSLAAWGSSATELFIVTPSSCGIGASCPGLRPASSNWFTDHGHGGRLEPFASGSGEVPVQGLRFPRDVHRLGQCEDPVRHALQGDGVLCGTERYSLPGHTPDDAGGLVLRHRAAAAVQHLLQAPGAVLAHPGEQCPDGIASGVLRHRAEQH